MNLILQYLDVDGYNYFLESQSKFFVRDSATAHRFETEHAKHPAKDIYCYRIHTSKRTGKLGDGREISLFIGKL